MRLNESCSDIDEATLEAAVQRYDGLVPDSLKPLDEQRYHLVPTAVAERREAHKNGNKQEPHITKAELVQLMEWKLYLIPSVTELT